MKTLWEISTTCRWSESQLTVAAASANIKPTNVCAGLNIYADRDAERIIAAAAAMFADCGGIGPNADGKMIQADRTNDIEG